MTDLSDELIGKECIFNLVCDISYSFHYAVVADAQKVQNHKKVSDVVRSPDGGVELCAAVSRGGSTSRC